MSAFEAGKEAASEPEDMSDLNEEILECCRSDHRVVIVVIIRLVIYYIYIYDMILSISRCTSYLII